MKYKNIRIGVDLGGTKIAATAIDQNNQPIIKKRIPAPKNDFKKTINAIAKIIHDVEKKCSLKPENTKIGLAMPGSISPKTGLVQNSNSQWINGQNIKKNIQNILQKKIKIENDANCFTLSEAMEINVEKNQSIFGIIIGTGCGGGIVRNKKIIKGAHHTAGEWGHMPLPWKKNDEITRKCWCGRQNCLEKWISGPALQYDHKIRTKQNVKPEKIAQYAQNGDKNAIHSINIYADRLARAIAVIINIIDPHTIIIGGGLSNIKYIYQILPEYMPKYLFADHCNINIIPPKYGDDSGARGAAMLWKPQKN